MSRPTSLANDPTLAGLTSLTSLNRQPLTPQQQMEALKRVQGQAEQRVKLGMQLFKAAEARLSNHTDVLQQIKVLQDQLREQVNDDVAKSLHSYDQWIGQIDESFTNAIRQLEQKIDAVQANVVKSEGRIQEMLTRAEAMLDQSRYLVEKQSLNQPQAPAQSQSQALPPAVITPAFPLKALETVPAAPPVAESQAIPEPSTISEPPTISESPQKTEPSPIVEQAKQAQAKLEKKIEPAPASPDPEPATHDPHEKIYSTLLKKLIEDDKQNDTPPENADAA